MKVRKNINKEERHIIIAMIVDSTVLGRISTKWQRNMFKSKWANIISKWCVSYYRKYEDAPLHQIESLYESWAAKSKDKETISMVGSFLDSLSEEYEDLQEESNSDYSIDKAGEYFNRVKVERLAEQIQGDVDRGNITDAIKR